jgi:hypothetical protein
MRAKLGARMAGESYSKNDLNQILKQLLDRAEKIMPAQEETGVRREAQPCKDIENDQNPTRGEGCHPAPTASDFGGDPRNAYRELRRYLMDIGIDTRVFSFGSIPLPKPWNKSTPNITHEIASVDNSFFFDMRKPIQSGVCWHDEADKPECVNALVIMFRVFFESGMDDTRFWVQAVLNHHHDGILRLNELYGKIIIPQLKELQWSQPTRGQEGKRVSYFEKCYADIDVFKQDFNRMYHRYRQAGMRGNNMVQYAG